VAEDELVCPRCDKGLAPFTAFEAQLHRCESCEGVWVPSAFVAALANKPELRARLMPLAKRTAGSAATEVSPALAKPAHCATCRAQLARFEAGGASKIFLDTCSKGHGTWFDKDELGRVVAFLQANPKAELAAPKPAQPQRGHQLKKPPATSSSSSDDDGAGEVAVAVLAVVLDILF
jgi:Zn-finger nucleic acid-binding protein